MAYGLQFTEGSQGKNSRQELEAETNGCMLLTGLLSYFSYIGKAHVSKEGTTQWAETSSINYQSRNAQYACPQANLREETLHLGFLLPRLMNLTTEAF